MANPVMVGCTRYMGFVLTTKTQASEALDHTFYVADEIARNFGLNQVQFPKKEIGNNKIGQNTKSILARRRFQRQHRPRNCKKWKLEVRVRTIKLNYNKHPISPNPPLPPLVLPLINRSTFTIVTIVP